MPLTHDYSALSILASCARLYQLKYKRHLRPEGDEPPYLRGGQAGHAALNALYTQDWDLELALAALAEEWGDYTPKGKHDYLTLGHMELVIEDYMRDREENPTVLEAEKATPLRLNAEQALVVEWPHPFTGEVLEIGGKVDLPTAMTTQNYIVDHKFTTSWVNSRWATRFQIGHQFRIYVAMLQVLTGQKFEGAYVNAVYMGQPPKSGWDNVKSNPNTLYGPFHYTDEHLAETWEWAAGLMRTAELYEELDWWPQNEASCTMYSGCDYLDICERSPAMRPFVEKQLYRVKEPSGVLVSGADG